MSSRKDLKKSIKHICGELFADCCALRLCQQGDEQKLDELMAEVLIMHDDYVARVSHTDKANAAAYFKALRKSFDAKADELCEAIVKA